MGDDSARGQIESLREAIRNRLTMFDVCAKDGIEGRREGRAWRCRCPFHEEKSASFLIGGRSVHRAHCFGCNRGWDIFDFWMERKGVPHLEAVNQLASLCGLAPVMQGVKWERPKAKALASVRGEKRFEKGEKPRLPTLRALRPDEIVTLAKLRGLNPVAVRLAAGTFRRVAGCAWPLTYDRRANRWRSVCETHYLGCQIDRADCSRREVFPSWVVTDESRWVAQFRRLDGEQYSRRDKGKTEPTLFKSWTVGTATWPLGAAEIGHRVNVLFCEGGADMLAAYHFLHFYGRLRDVAVVCILGGSMIAEAALPYFAGKRVRIICDNDEERVKVTKHADGTESQRKTRAGSDTAARWTDQLTAAGAVVKTFFLGDVRDEDGALLARGLVRKTGEKVKDLNDLVYCAAEVLDSDVRHAFTEWREGFGG